MGTKKDTFNDFGGFDRKVGERPWTFRKKGGSPNARTATAVAKCAMDARAAAALELGEAPQDIEVVGG